MVVIKKSGGYVQRVMTMTLELEIEPEINLIVLSVVVEGLVKTIIFCPYSQRLHLNGIPPRMGS